MTVGRGEKVREEGGGLREVEVERRKRMDIDRGTDARTDMTGDG